MQRHSPSIAYWCDSAFGVESLHDPHNQHITLEERTALSFLTDEESAALSVRRMILHVVGTEGTFEAQEEQREIEHEPFFLDRIRNNAIDGVHSFEDESEAKLRLERIAQGELAFQTGGQELARVFSRAHVRTSVPGAFFLFELDVNAPGTTLYSMIKYDYQNALELVARDGRQSLRVIVQAFVTDRRAIQKSCLVRVVNGSAEPLVSAFDRMGRSPDLTDYFQSFLEVRRSRDDAELSAGLNELLRTTLSACREILPRRDVVAALDLSKESLRGRDLVDESAIREAIFVGSGSPADEHARTQLDRATTRALKHQRMTGVSFCPAPSVLARRPRRQIKTAESVVLSYPGEEEGRSVMRERQPSGAGWIITIRTQREFVEDATLAIKAGGSA